MRVRKNENGKMVLEDQPTVLTGSGGRKFLAEVERRNREGNTPERQRFIDECAALYVLLRARRASR